jgi:D-alanyl-D-alanine carboxypeptidase
MQRKLGLIGMLVVFASTMLVAQTPTQRMLDLWLQAFNSGDRAKLTAFWNTYNPQWPQIDRELHVRKESGGLTLIKVASDDGTRLEAVVADAGEMFLGLSVEMQSVDPPKIDRIVLHGVPTQDGIVEPFASDRELVKGVKARVDSLAAADKFAGTVIIARNGRVLMQAACGEAERASHKRVNLDTQFRIGSMNKMFTAVAVLQLIEQKKLSLDGTVGDYWRDYPNRDVATKVTIRHLLTHTAGTGDIFTPEFNEHRLQIQTLNDYAKLYGTRALEFEPGSQFRYSNYGFLLLGILIERVSGVSYYDYMQKNIYEPAGMNSTGSLPEGEPVPGRATGYLPGKAGWEPNTDTLPWRGTSAGGGYSTAGDLVKFAAALEHGKLLNAHWLAEATREQTPNSKYGFGFEAQGSYFGHSGAAPGINGELRIYPKTGHVIAVLSNLEPPSAMQVAAFSGHRLPAR